MIASCSPEIRAEWEKCAEDGLKAIRQEITSCEKEKSPRSEKRVKHLRKEQEQLAKRLYSQDNRVVLKPYHGGDSFNPILRCVNLNPATMSKGTYLGERPDKNGTEQGEPLVISTEGRAQYRMSLQHTLCHEDIHSTRPNSYRFVTASLQLRKEFPDKRANAMSSTDFTLNDELFKEKIEEHYTIALTNRIMQHYYGEERREGHATPPSAKTKAVTHLSKMEEPSTAHSLPVLTNERNGKPVQIHKPDYTVEEMKALLLNSITRDSPNPLPEPENLFNLSKAQVTEVLVARSAVLSARMDAMLSEINLSKGISPQKPPAITR